MSDHEYLAHQDAIQKGKADPSAGQPIVTAQPLFRAALQRKLAQRRQANTTMAAEPPEPVQAIAGPGVGDPAGKETVVAIEEVHVAAGATTESPHEAARPGPDGPATAHAASPKTAGGAGKESRIGGGEPAIDFNGTKYTYLEGFTFNTSPKFLGTPRRT